MGEYTSGFRQIAFLFVVGAVLGVAASRMPTRADDAGTRSNVVVLRGEKRVSLVRGGIPLSEMAAAFQEQTGRAFTLDESLAKPDKRYSFILSNTPLTGALAASARMTDATWEKRGGT
jgi:hypothetical protein